MSLGCLVVGIGDSRGTGGDLVWSPWLQKETDIFYVMG